ncbi:MAG: carboxypeptidase regulatory-like domain-containing protein, partial [Planctomycetota bacterium]
MRNRVGQSRLLGKILGYGAAAVAALILLCWAGYYSSSSLAYAKVGKEIKLYRDDADPDRLALDYTPKSTGVIGISRTEDGRTTELLPRTFVGQENTLRRLEWRVDDLKTGDIIKVTYKKGLSLGTTEIVVPEFVARGDLPAVEAMSGSVPSAEPIDGAALSGRIVSALDGEPVSGAEVRIGGTELSEQTDTKGNFRIVGIPEGSQKIEVAAAGYASRQFERELNDGMETAYQVALKPKAEGGNIRIALDWDEESEDLDAHLEGPLPKGGKFHIDRHHPGTDETKGVVALMADDEAKGGPETVEVAKVVPGTYRYFVHDFSNRHDPAGKGLARSGAQVTVSYGGESYRFRPKTKEKGNLWDVCTIEVTDDGGVVNRIDAFQGIKPELLGLYDRRTKGDRDAWITNYGGSVASEKAVTDGLDWLARHQGPNGFWSNECLAGGEWSQCKGGHCDEDGDGIKAGRKYEMAQTGLSLLAFQAGGHYYFNSSQYSDQVRKGLDWLVDQQEADGALVSKKSRGGHSKYHTFYMYDHGIATFALADACAAAKALGQPRNDKYYGALKQAVNYIY